ncbi:MAG TPA: alpha/beta fold hydrolase [Stellaceae bacterium]|nr:alpha/beta fold hydrolase [Stellaceae bacterium]
MILAGSGPTDRDGNQPALRNDSLKLLARDLAGFGIASLRADKRGIGESAAAVMSERDLRFVSYVDDAVAWVRSLRAQARVRSIFLLGHSEGALVATLAAQRDRVEGLISIAGPGFPAGTVLRRQLEASGPGSPLREAAEAALTNLEKGEEVLNVPKELAVFFRSTVQPYLISWLPIDPAAELAKVMAPVLAIQGTTDIQVSLADARRLQRARSDVEVAILEGVNHILKHAPPDRAPNIATYGNPALPLAPAVVPRIVAFIQQHAR